ncbi:serine hydrolase domain-containing protein [uncultured Psychroserpens sp.]|uniref:serine hydrolase domain-containing protein n=1 Tax=uncultured Psychroserpens sp. TaxID=255436 RepID=UPI0026184072|nr:serine hydrolase domain-containing protein [uncultured Psychroserpens sp.]
MNYNSKIFKVLMFSILLINCNSNTKNNQNIYKGERLQMYDYLNLRSQTASYSGTVLVARNDSVIFSKGFGFANREQQIANNKDTKFKIGSITKTFTAVAILQLQEKGQLSVEDKLSKFLTDFPNSQNIQIKHLLNHSSGLPQDWRESWHESRVFNFDSIISIIGKQTLLFKPGTSEEYSNGGYALLTKIIEQVSGLTYEEYCEKYIFLPAKMKNTGAVFNPQETYENFASGYQYGEGKDGYNTNIEAQYVFTPNLKGQASAYSTVKDLYNYHLALKNKTLLNESSTQLMLSKLPNSEYTLGSWLNVETKTNGILSYCSGVSNGFESVMYRYLDKNRSIIALNNHQNTDVFNISRTMSAIVDEKKIYNPQIRSEIPIEDISSYNFIKGKYMYPDDVEDFFEIIIKDARVFVFSNNEPLEELFLYKPNYFFSKNYDLQLDFSEKGKCLWIYNGVTDAYMLEKDSDEISK